MYTIKETAEKLKMNENAIRFYEKKGLIHPKRLDNNYRVFDLPEISRLEMIVLYRKMGFSIEAIRAMLKKEENGELLGQFAAQYEILNVHIHTMVAVRETLGRCVEHLLNQPELDDSMIEAMEESAKVIEKCQSFEDHWDFDDWAASYDKDIRKDGEGVDFYKNYDQVLAMTAQAVEGERIVEIGVGTGNLARQIIERGVNPENYIGVDQSVNMLKEAKKKCSEILLRIGTFLQLPLADHSCDCVVSSYAFHHNDAPQKKLAIEEMDRILTAKGMIIITDLMFADQQKRDEYEAQCNEQLRYELADEYFANVDEMETILTTCGYEVESTQIDSLMWRIVAKKIKPSHCMAV